jgi:2-oxoglutarate dehydrogenase E2 component (dihydrolipoamide succinyltransferase)
MAIDIVIPQAGESVTSGVVLRWVKKPGEGVKRDEVVLEVETDKITLEVTAPAAGVLAETLVKEGETVKIGQAVGRVDDKAVAPAGRPEVRTTVGSGVPAGVGAEGEVRVTPLAKKTAEQLHVDVSKIHGTGPGGRVREADVIGANKGSGNGHANGPAAGAAASVRGGVTREKMSPMRMRIAQRLVQAQHTAAMLTTFNECDMGEVMELRKAHKEEFEKRHGIGLGFMGFFVRAVVQALRAFPLVNASIAEENGNLMVERHEACDVAVAVSTPKGLVVPVVRNAQSLSLAGIEWKIKDLATRGRDGKLALDEMQGGTFTITNGGVFGSLLSTPILNPPQSAILGMHTIKSRPVEYPGGSGQIALRPMMYLALSYDHRLVDGAEAVQFLVKIKQAIEDPQRLLLEI